MDELTLEQQFKLCAFKLEIQQMSIEQAHHFLIQMMELMMRRENAYKQLLAQEWGIDSAGIGWVQ